MKAPAHPKNFDLLVHRTAATTRAHIRTMSNRLATPATVTINSGPSRHLHTVETRSSTRQSITKAWSVKRSTMAEKAQPGSLTKTTIKSHFKQWNQIGPTSESNSTRSKVRGQRVTTVTTHPSITSRATRLAMRRVAIAKLGGTLQAEPGLRSRTTSSSKVHRVSDRMGSSK